MVNIATGRIASLFFLHPVLDWKEDISDIRW
jgi:hypothetical protein